MVTVIKAESESRKREGSNLKGGSPAVKLFVNWDTEPYPLNEI
jgi:hypothetical protein